MFRDWRRACPASIEIVPALVLHMYDREAAPVFSSADLLIIELNTETPPHDAARSFYRQLREGRRYEGFYSKPWRELCEIYLELSECGRSGVKQWRR